MKFSICNELFVGWEFGQVCSTASNIGYQGVEVAPFTLGTQPCALGAAERAQLVRAASVANVEIVGLHWLLAQTEGFHISHGDPDVRDRTASYLCDLAQLCADFGGRVMVFGSPAQRSALDGVTIEQAWQNALDTFRSLTPVLERLRVVLCIEPLAPNETNLLNYAADAARMIRALDSEYIKLILDVKAMSAEDSSPADVIRANAELLAHVHANDANKRGPGFGNTDFVPIGAALRDIHYTGWVSVKVFDFSPDPLTVARGSMEYLQKSFAA